MSPEMQLPENFERLPQLTGGIPEIGLTYFGTTSNPLGDFNTLRLDREVLAPEHMGMWVRPTSVEREFKGGGHVYAFSPNWKHPAGRYDGLRHRDNSGLWSNGTNVFNQVLPPPLAKTLTELFIEKGILDKESFQELTSSVPRDIHRPHFPSSTPFEEKKEALWSYPGVYIETVLPHTANLTPNPKRQMAWIRTTLESGHPYKDEKGHMLFDATIEGEWAHGHIHYDYSRPGLPEKTEELVRARIVEVATNVTDYSRHPYIPEITTSIIVYKFSPNEELPQTSYLKAWPMKTSTRWHSNYYSGWR